MFDGRLTLVSGTPIMSSDVTSSTLYYTQHCGDKITIGGSDYSFTELSLSLSGLTANAIYDVFAGLSSGAPYLFLSSAWTNATTRASALARNNGILTDNGNTGTWLGTIQIDPTAGQCSAHFSYGPSRKFGVWNAYNQRLIILQAGIAPPTSGTTWYTPTVHPPSWGPARGDTGNSLTVLSGQPVSAALSLQVSPYLTGYGPYYSSQYTCSIGWNSSTSPSGAWLCTTFEPTIANGESIAVGWTSSIEYDPPPLTGSGTAYAIENCNNMAQLWSGIVNMQLTAKWLG